MKKVILSIFLALAAFCGAVAQEDNTIVVQETVQKKDSLSEAHKITGNAAFDVVSRYIWRGFELGSAAIQPYANLSWRGLSLDAWASFGFIKSSDAKEFDLTLSYANHGFNIGITDYWSTGDDDSYFSYGWHDMTEEVEDPETGEITEFTYQVPTHHVFEANIGYDFGFLNLQWYTIFAGADYNESGKQAFASYFEISAPFKLVTCNWNASVGVSPYKSPYYGNNKFACTSVDLRCTKDIHVYKKFYIPIFAEFIANPLVKKAYFVAGFTIAPWGL